MLEKLHQIICGHIIDRQGHINYIKNNRIKALLELTEENNYIRFYLRKK